MDLRTSGPSEMIVLCANLAGLGSRGVGAYTPRDVTMSCAVDVGARRVARVIVTKPDKDASDMTVPFTMEGSHVRFPLSIHALAAAFVVLD